MTTSQIGIRCQHHHYVYDDDDDDVDDDVDDEDDDDDVRALLPLLSPRVEVKVLKQTLQPPNIIPKYSQKKTMYNCAKRKV